MSENEKRGHGTLRRMFRGTKTSIVQFMKRNADSFANLLIALSPVTFLVLGIHGMQYRGYFAFGGEWFLIVPWLIAIWVLKSYAHVVNRSANVPVPNHRFTEVSVGGNVSVDEDRIMEMVVFVADYEDWLERMGYEF